jgi:hypothetical protein
MTMSLIVLGLAGALAGLLLLSRRQVRAPSDARRNTHTSHRPL